MLKQRFGTPYLHYPVLPIGAYECRRFLQKVAEYAGLDMSPVTRYIQQEEKGFYYYLERAAELLTHYNGTFPERFFIIADSMYTLGISRFLFNDLGLLPGNQYIIDNPSSKYRKSIESQFSLPVKENTFQVVFAEEPADIRERIEQQIGERTPLILGSSWDAEIASQLGGYFLGISAPVSGRLVLDRSYAGYRGGLRLAEDIYSTILSDSF
jgi:nitrogenase molybdenum-iron protein beta chain